MLAVVGAVAGQTGWLDQDQSRAITIIGIAGTLGFVLWSAYGWWRDRRIDGQATPTMTATSGPMSNDSGTQIGPVTDSGTINYTINNRGDLTKTPEPWFLVTSDLATVNLTDADLDRMLDQAQARAKHVLAADARVEFRRMWLQGQYRMLVFRAWSDIANERTEVTVDHLGRVENVNEAKGALGRDPRTPPWKLDTEWRTLVRLAAPYARTRSSAILKAVVAPMPGWSLWQIQLGSTPDQDYRDPTTYGLLNGKIEEVPTSPKQSEPEAAVAVVDAANQPETPDVAPVEDLDEEVIIRHPDGREYGVTRATWHKMYEAQGFVIKRTGPPDPPPSSRVVRDGIRPPTNHSGAHWRGLGVLRCPYCTFLTTDDRDLYAHYGDHTEPPEGLENRWYDEPFGGWATFPVHYIGNGRWLNDAPADALKTIYVARARADELVSSGLYEHGVVPVDLKHGFVGMSAGKMMCVCGHEAESELMMARHRIDSEVPDRPVPERDGPSHVEREMATLGNPFPPRLNNIPTERFELELAAFCAKRAAVVRAFTSLRAKLVMVPPDAAKAVEVEWDSRLRPLWAQFQHLQAEWPSRDQALPNLPPFPVKPYWVGKHLAAMDVRLKWLAQHGARCDQG